MNEIAEELVRVARSLIGETYPIGASEKVRAILDDCRLCLGMKQIYNAKLNDYKHSLTGNLSRILSPGGASRGVWLFGYNYDFLVSGFSEIPKAIRNLEKLLKMREMPNEIFSRHSEDDHDNIKGAWGKPLEGHLEVLKSWLPVKGLLDELKGYVTKGKAPTGLPPKTYLAPLPSLKVGAFVKGELEKLVNPLAGDMKTVRKAELMEKVLEADKGIQKFLIDYPEKGGRLDIASRAVIGKDAHLYNLCMSVIEGMGGGKPYGGLSKDFESKIEKAAKEEVEDMVMFFVDKNTRKIAPIITTKGGLKGAKILFGKLVGFGLWGEIRFDFEDGTNFTVRNKLVSKWNYNGTIHQFPTTFHDVKFPDGKVRLMLSEEEMNVYWALAK